MTLNIQRTNSRRWLAAILGIALLAGGWFAAQQFLNATRVEQKVAPQAEVREIPALTLAEAQKQIAFNIPQPGWLPAGLILKGSHVNPPNWANVFYGYADGKEAGLGIQVAPSTGLPNYVFPESARQPVIVNGQPATYIHGAWNAQGQWNDNEDAAALEWSANGFAFHLSGSDLGLTREDLIRIAESVK
jgi:hypothetical protein